MAKEQLKKLNADTPEIQDAMQMSDEMLEKTRLKTCQEFRERYGKWMEVYDEEPGKEFVDQVKKEFDEEIAKFRNKTFIIAEDHALEYAQMVKRWNAAFNHWENGAWKGVVTLDSVMGEMVKTFEANPELPFEVTFQTLIFLYQSMANPKGYGLEGAKLMAELEHYDEATGEIAKDDNFITYSHLLQNINDNVREVMNADKKHKLMRERINIALAGIKFDWKISEIEEFIELHDAWIGGDLPTDQELARM